MGSGAGDPVAVELIPVYQNVTQVIVQTELQQAITGRGMRPSVFIAVVNNQAAGLGCCLESLVVVGVAPAAILNAADVIVVVYHLMQQRGAHFFDGARQCSRADIDFMCAAQLGNPRIFPEGEVAVGLGG